MDQVQIYGDENCADVDNLVALPNMPSEVRGFWVDFHPF
jgi:hypothetical protein